MSKLGKRYTLSADLSEEGDVQTSARMTLGSLMLVCLSVLGAPLRPAHADVPPGPPPNVLPTAPAPAQGGELRFQFVQLKEGGMVRCALYATPADYMKKSFRETAGTVSGGRALCVFANLAPGTYSMAAFHDTNNNAKLDTGIFGIPAEGVCTSNNAKGRLGPPKYKDAAFNFSGSPLTQELRMFYR